ncbi:MAG: trypsin-like peptidase domain-containing protein [Planctomycetota bacterium]
MQGSSPRQQRHAARARRWTHLGILGATFLTGWPGSGASTSTASAQEFAGTSSQQYVDRPVDYERRGGADFRGAPILRGERSSAGPPARAGMSTTLDPATRDQSLTRSRRPALEVPRRRISLAEQREQMFQELEAEFATFDRLGSLVRRVATLVKPSVIHIEAHKTEGSGSKSQSYDEAGSGVIYRGADGADWVLTNRHVIHGAAPGQILLRDWLGNEFAPVKVLTDASTDVAIMKLPTVDLPPAKIGDSDRVQIGDFCIAIGSPFGLSHSVTFGILSAKGRRDLTLGEQKIDLQDFFQTDAAINPGNSGGPLLSLRGEVVAINTAIASSSGGSEGIGFAIPINMARQVADQLIQFGRLRRGYLGVTLDPEFTAADLAAVGVDRTKKPELIRGGALVKNVRESSPAALANLRRGDVIVQFGGRSIDDDDHLVAQVGLTPVGKPVRMVVYRSGAEYETFVTLIDLN